MTDANKKLMKILMVPAIIFMFYPIALGIKVYFALSTNQPMMEENYYDIGRDFDTHRKAANSGNRDLISPYLAADYQLLAGLVRIPVQVIQKGEQDGVPVEGAKVSFRISRPATMNQDRTFHCITDAAGKCSLVTDIPPGGKWETTIASRDPGGSFTHMKTFEIH